VEEPFTPSRKAHIGFRVRPGTLDSLARRLDAAGARVTWDDALPGGRRFFAEDPWGNRIEFLSVK
jgi:catechol 2,3-dioxygenase-like lactoylglutathione lyase family enzyme